MSWEELLELLSAFCNHPAVIFGSKICDLVRAGGKDEPDEET